MAEHRSDGRDPEFERSLERMFAQAPALPDGEVFAQRVQKRLARSWTVRTLAIGFAGVVGGAIAASQILGAGLAVQVREASAHSAQIVDAAYRQTWSNLDALSQVTPSAALFWAVSGLMILAAVVGATRVLDEV
jgi:hypothetical protein